jgi:FkbM family methyltransferase
METMPAMKKVLGWAARRRDDGVRLVRYSELLSNGPTVWLRDNMRKPLPPLRFRNGLVQYHGKDDDPLLLLDEVFIRRLYSFKTVTPPDATMVDIGANIGAVLQFFALSATSLRIHAYEPNPAAYEVLQRNVQDNGLAGRTTTFPEAVGRFAGRLSLWVDVPTVLSTAYGDAPPSEGGRRVEVSMVNLDEVWRRLQLGPIWLLKIDTEGAEGDILEGASKACLSAVQNAIVEYHDNIVPGVSERCYRVLRDAGFSWQTFVHPWSEGIIYATR